MPRRSSAHASGRRPRAERPKRRSLGGWLVRAVLGAAVSWLVGTTVVVASLRWIDPPVTAMMLQQQTPVADLEHEWAGRARIAAAAAQAVIASEDQRFLTHNGFDLVSIEQAFADYRAGGDLRGASTITQQVAKNLFLWPGRSFVRKGIEAYFTLLIESCWSKERILEVYLNVAELGPDLFGVEAAARRFFGKSAAELSAEQAALLAAVLPSPRRYSAQRPSGYVRDRQSWVLRQMRSLDHDGHFRTLDW